MIARPVHFQSNLSNVGTPVVPLKFCAMPGTHIGDKRPAPRGTNFYSVDKHHAVVLVRLDPLVSKKASTSMLLTLVNPEVLEVYFNIGKWFYPHLIVFAEDGSQEPAARFKLEHFKCFGYRID